MNRRKFLNIGSMMAALGLTGVSFAKNLDFNIKEIKLMDEMEKLKVVDAYFKKAELIEYPKGKKFYARVRNINTNYLKDDAEVRFEITSENLYPFNFMQGEYAIQLLPMTYGFVRMYLYKREGSDYVQVGENISNLKIHTYGDMSWYGDGVRLVVSEP